MATYAEPAADALGDAESLSPGARSAAWDGAGLPMGLWLPRLLSGEHGGAASQAIREWGVRLGQGRQLRISAPSESGGGMSEVARFIVYGTPEPKGSSRAFVPKGWTRAIVTSANPNLKGWASLVRNEAQKATLSFIGVSPVRVSLHFSLQRPKRLQTKTWRGRSLWHTTKPDLDKLARAVKDALTGVIWADDAQVAQLLAEKSYTDAEEGPCCHVCVETLEIDR